MIMDVFLVKKVPRLEFGLSQEELYQHTLNNLEKFVPGDYTCNLVEPDFLQSIPDALNMAINNTSSPLIMVADVGVLFLTPLNDIIDRFNTEPEIGLIGLKLVSRNFEIVDVGIENPLGFQPIFRRFQDSPESYDILIEDYNTYIDSKLAIIRRKAFDDVGGFDAESDAFYMINFCYDIARRKWKVLYLPEEVMYTNYYETCANSLDDIYRPGQEWFRKKLNDIKQKNKPKNLDRTRAK